MGESTEMKKNADVVDNKLAMEYEMQFFNFMPRGFVDTVCNVVIQFLTDRLRSTFSIVGQNLLPSTSNNSKNIDITDDIAHVQNQIECRITDKVNGVLDNKLEELFEPVFKIPAHIVLEEDEINLEWNKEAQLSGREVKLLGESIEEMERDIKYKIYLNRKAKKELDQVKMTEDYLDERIEQMNKLIKTSKLSDDLLSQRESELVSSIEQFNSIQKESSV